MNKGFRFLIIIPFLLSLLLFSYLFRTNYQLKQDLENNGGTKEEMEKEIVSLKEAISAKQEELSILSENERMAELTLWEDRLEQLKEVAE